MSEQVTNKKPQAQSIDILRNLSSQVPCDADAEASWPTLLRFLTPTWQEGVCVRQGSTISIKAEGTYWRVTIVCPTERYQASLLTDHLTDLFGQLDAIVTDSRTPWLPTWERAKKSRPVIEDAL